MKLDRRLIRLLVAIAAALVAWFFNLDTSGPTGPAARSGTSDVVRAIDTRASNQWVETDAIVTRLLGDDNHGSRHQRILVSIAGRSVLIAHNIDLADRVPARKGDTLRIRGEFEWNEKGGVIHWTHHDPQGRHGGGWIEHRGKRFD